MSRRGRRTGLWAAGAALLVLAALAVFLHLGMSPEDRDRLDMFSSISPAPDGTKALYTLLGDLGYRTRRSMGPIDEIDWEETDLVVLVSPLRPFEESEVGPLLAWIEEGGTVLLAGTFTRAGPLGSPSFDPDDPFARHPPPGPLAADRDAEWEREPSELKSRLLEGVEKLEYRHIFSDRLNEVAVRLEEPAWRKGPHEVLVGEELSFLEVTTVADGRVMKVLDENILLNRSIRMGHNLVFVLNVLEEWGGQGRIVFEEGHRSLLPQEQPQVWEVLGPASEVAFLQLLLAVLAGIVALGWRPAPPLPERRESRRRALMQVEALAGMMETAGAARLAVRLMHRRTRHLWEAGRFAPAPGPRGKDGARMQASIFRRMESLARRVDSMPAAGRKELTRYIGLFRQLRRGERKR